MRIRVESRVRATLIDAPAVRRAAAYVLRRERRPEGCELGVLFAGERLMRSLNRRYRGVDRGTDVLAFPLEGAGLRGRPRDSASTKKGSGRLLHPEPLNLNPGS